MIDFIQRVSEDIAEAYPEIFKEANELESEGDFEGVHSLLEGLFDDLDEIIQYLIFYGEYSYDSYTRNSFLFGLKINTHYFCYYQSDEFLKSHSTDPNNFLDKCIDEEESYFELEEKNREEFIEELGIEENDFRIELEWNYIRGIEVLKINLKTFLKHHKSFIEIPTWTKEKHKRYLKLKNYLDFFESDSLTSN